MRKLPVLAALVLGGAGFGAFAPATADQLPAGVEGCIASDPVSADARAQGAPSALYPKTCQYKATRTGGFVGGAAKWTVTVYRPSTNQTFTYTGTNSQACNTGSTVPGDVVTVSLTNGLIAAGNPFPSATDGSIAAGNRC